MMGTLLDPRMAPAQPCISPSCSFRGHDDTLDYPGLCYTCAAEEVADTLATIIADLREARVMAELLPTGKLGSDDEELLAALTAAVREVASA